MGSSSLPSEGWGGGGGGGFKLEHNSNDESSN